jgi:CDP-diacylglycerol---glycerol-3-phosphate 3-phosphatidyltransferase
MLDLTGFQCGGRIHAVMLANLITAGRVGLVFIAVGLLYTHTVWGAVAAFVLVLTAIIMDWLDGFLARRTHSESPFGAVMDILGDRIVENTLWIVFAHLGLIPVWVPIVVVVRGFVTDSFRSVALTQGETPFGERTMIKSRIGRLIVSSRSSRTLYAIAKVVAFCYLILYFALLNTAAESSLGAWGFAHDFALHAIGQSLVYFTVTFCLIRALPVVQDGLAQVKRLRAATRG